MLRAAKRSKPCVLPSMACSTPLCSQLREFRWPSHLTTVAEGVFSGCTGLSSIVGLERITDIGPSAFEDCASLATLPTLTHVTNISAYAFARSGLTRFVWPAAALAIPTGAFSDCASLVSVRGVRLVTQVGPHAFGRTGLVGCATPADMCALPSACSRPTNSTCLQDLQLFDPSPSNASAPPSPPPHPLSKRRRALVVIATVLSALLLLLATHLALLRSRRRRPSSQPSHARPWTRHHAHAARRSERRSESIRVSLIGAQDYFSAESGMPGVSMG